MFKAINGVTFYYHYLTPFDQQKETVVCLHGFTGTYATFKRIPFSKKFNFIAIDLIGHGQTSVHVDAIHYTMTQAISDLHLLLEQLNIQQYYLLGYSMGGRIALAWSCLYPTEVLGLIMESGSPGIQEEAERIKRKGNDQKLAQRLLTAPLGDFIDFWQELPLFASQKQLPISLQEEIRQERLSQNPKGLAQSLLSMGTGDQNSYWDCLADLLMPILYIAGGLDDKFIKIGQAMQVKQPLISLTNVIQAGHCVHIEQPQQFANIVNQWLLKKVGN